LRYRGLAMVLLSCWLMMASLMGAYICWYKQYYPAMILALLVGVLGFMLNRVWTRGAVVQPVAMWRLQRAIRRRLRACESSYVELMGNRYFFMAMAELHDQYLIGYVERSVLDQKSQQGITEFAAEFHVLVLGRDRRFGGVGVSPTILMLRRTRTEAGSEYWAAGPEPLVFESMETSLTYTGSAPALRRLRKEVNLGTFYKAGSKRTSPNT
jgi:hypothetical protein